MDKVEKSWIGIRHEQQREKWDSIDMNRVEKREGGEAEDPHLGAAL